MNENTAKFSPQMPLVAAVRLVDRTEIPLQGLTKLTLRASLSSPAQSLACTAAVAELPGELGAVVVRRADGTSRPLFEGRVDRQEETLSSAGRMLTLEARSKGALLLDNEAVPCLLAGANLAAVFGMFVAPYGFVLGEREPTGKRLAAYTVHKGMSEWEALCEFCQRIYGKTPTLRGDVVAVGPPPAGAPLVVGGAGLPFTALRRTREPYRMLSKVVLRDAQGRYAGAVRNSAAGYYGVQRKRYVIPPNEFVDTSAPDANRRIRRSMLQSETVEAVLPGWVQVLPGQAARVLQSGTALENLLVQEVTHHIGPSGAETQLQLVSSLYVD